MTLRVDLNADVGEGMGDDAALLDIVTSANIACGLHAGDARTMADTVALCLRRGVAIGAHPSFDDREGFGRRDMNIAPEAARALVLRQIEAVATIAAAAGARLKHVKPHGALYNMAARDPALAGAIAEAVREFDSNLLLVGLAGSALMSAGESAGLRVASEAFADRAYRKDGTLVPRSQPGALIEDADLAVARALDMVRTAAVRSIDGAMVAVRAETICVHGDTPGAAAMAGVLRAALEDAGVAVCAP
ncbi:MAG: LamB/YcsF family protein [Burkholderiales bacterium]|nr:LamB/YcsF family protein [Burkholderiales bacterium]